MKYRLKITKNDKTTQCTTLRKKSKVVAFIKANNFSELKLEVEYQPDVTNSGTFITKVDALKCLREWTEPSQIEYCTTGSW